MSLTLRDLTPWAVVLVVALLGGTWYWGTSTIIADSTPPQIDELATTHGALGYFTGQPKVLCVFTENIGVQSVKAQLYTVGLLGTKGSLLEEITLTKDTEEDGRYQYSGRFTETLEPNKDYWVKYTVTDTAGQTDTWETKIRLVQVEAEVYVNGKKVEYTWSKVYVTSLDLEIVVKFPTGASQVADVYATINSQKVTFVKNYVGEWVGRYTLPGDGSYTLYVKVVDTAGGESIVASFGLVLGTEQRTPLIIGTLGVLGVATVYMATKNKPKTRRG